jgi:hypothetical protein
VKNQHFVNDDGYFFGGRMQKNLSLENRLKPVTLSGLLLPIPQPTLVTPHGTEYPLIAEGERGKEIHRHAWEQVTVIGLLNTGNLTVLPQKVLPKGPKGNEELIPTSLVTNSRQRLKTAIQNFSELVLVPAALVALFMF